MEVIRWPTEQIMLDMRKASVHSNFRSNRQICGQGQRCLAANFAIKRSQNEPLRARHDRKFADKHGID